MQDRYVGDVGDFGKYGLLRSLCRADEHGGALRLGVLWYRFDGADPATGDGRHTDYLSRPSRDEQCLQECDADLLGKMLHLVNNRCHRLITSVETHGVLPSDTLFFSDQLSFDDTELAERCEKRRRWLDAGLRRVAEADVVFFDPDNGLEVPSHSPRSLRGPKYVYYDDLRSCWERGQSLVVYHHLGRSAGAGEQISAQCQKLREKLPGAEPVALRYRRRSPRVYFVLSRPEHDSRLRSAIRTFLDSPWACARHRHFELADCCSDIPNEWRRPPKRSCPIEGPSPSGSLAVG